MNDGDSRPDVQSCRNSHQEVCNSYAPCLPMQGTENGYRPLNDLVNTVCTADNISNLERRDECERACQSKSCCYTTMLKSNCFEGNAVLCDAFIACTILVVQPHESNHMDVGQSGQRTIPVIIPYTSKSEDTGGESDSDVSTADTDLGIGDTNDTLPTTLIPPMSVLLGPPSDYIESVCSNPSKTELILLTVFSS